MCMTAREHKMIVVGRCGIRGCMRVGLVEVCVARQGLWSAQLETKDKTASVHLLRAARAADVMNGQCGGRAALLRLSRDAGRRDAGAS